MNPRKFKYVIIDETFPLICSEGTSHFNLSGGAAGVTSAGFATLNFDPKTGDFSVSCFGESVGLKIGSKPTEDGEILRSMFVEPKW